LRHIELNNMLLQRDEGGFYRLEKDREAIAAFLEEVERRSLKFGSTKERLVYLIENDYYENVYEFYTPEEVDDVFRLAHGTGFAFASSAAEVWVLFLVYGLYFGLVEGSEKALVADLARPEQRGTAYGLYNLAFSVTVLPASLLLGALWAWRGAQTAFLTSAAVGAAAALLLALAVRAGAPNGRTA